MCNFQRSASSHLAALRDDNVLRWLVISTSASILNLLNHIHTLHNLAEHNVLAIEKRRRHARNEELRSIRIRSRILNKQLV